jgi:hypothetical protein
MYLGSELFTGFANVNTASFVDTWLKFFGLNMLWVIFPGIFIYESVRYLVSGGNSPFLVEAEPASPSRQMDTFTRAA